MIQTFISHDYAWEQRKLSDLAEIVGGGTPDTNNSAYWDGDIDWYAPAEMEGQRYVKGSVRKITELGLQKSSAKILPAHRTVIFTSRAGIGKMAILQRPAATNQGFQSLVLKDGTDPYFVYSMGEKIKDMAEGVASGSTFLEISGKMLGNLEVMVPNLKEQESIATFFRGIDDLITLHQRKCEQLKNVKKSMLQKMFPKDGETVPVIRFSGFTAPWEQCKLTDIADRVTRKNQDLVSELPLTISAQYGLIDQNEFFDKRIASKDVSGYYLIKKGEFAYNKSTSSDAPWGAIKRLDQYENGVLSTLYIVFAIIDEHLTDSDYLATYYDTILWHKDVQAIAAEGARNHGLLNIAPVDFFETGVSLPQDIEEQKRIGLFFKELDKLITLHQRKLDLLQNVKKSMLEKMFV